MHVLALNPMEDVRRKDSKTILIVDDDPLILDILVELIPLYGYESIVASSAMAALEKAKKHDKIDLLITDIKMPGMNGVDLAKRFLSLYPETRVLFMSGYALPAPSQSGIPEDEYFFIHKPFGTDTLISEIRNILDDSTNP